jgi:hypothetical protein
MKNSVLALIVTATTGAVLASFGAAANATKTGDTCTGGRNCIVVCGPTECAEAYNAAAVATPLTYNGTLTRAAAVPPQRFYTINYDTAPGKNVAAQLTYYLPQASLIRIPGGKGTLATWVHPSRAAAEALRAAAGNAAPYPTPTKLTHVIVDHSLANDPSSYLRLWTTGKPVRTAPGANGWLPISVTSDPASPWSDPLVSLAVSRHGAYVKREGQLYAIPASIAARARGGRSLGK